MNRLLISFTFLFFCTIQSYAQILDRAGQAFRLAEERNKRVLLVFEGSDWCAPCIRFEKKVLSEKIFREFADQELVVLQADFPQRKKMGREQQKQNDALAERYNPQGLFPYLLLLRADGSVIADISYHDEAAQAFISRVSSYLAHERSGHVQETN